MLGRAIELDGLAIVEAERLLAEHLSPDRIPQAALREFADRHLPKLDTLATRARAVLRCRGWLVLDRLGFLSGPDPIRDLLILCVAHALGRPTATDVATGRIIWPVTPRPDLPPGFQPSITERKGAAELHTDSSFARTPERYVALFVVRPAVDGGASTLIDGHSLLRRLQTSVVGRAATRGLLAMTYPFAVPPSFRRRPEVYEANYSTILSDNMIRYRGDVIRDGLANCSWLDTEAARWTLGVLETAIVGLSPLILPLQAGTALIVDNYRMLHGRTAFSDPQRLLLRVRMNPV